jgi:hypothetical protein
MAKNLALDMLRESYHKRTTLLDPDQETESDEWLERTLVAKDKTLGGDGLLEKIAGFAAKSIFNSDILPICPFRK